jgi:hypothetical protein
MGGGAMEINTVPRFDAKEGVRQNSSFKLPAAGHRCGQPVH